MIDQTKDLMAIADALEKHDQWWGKRPYSPTSHHYFAVAVHDAIKLLRASATSAPVQTLAPPNQTIAHWSKPTTYLERFGDVMQVLCKGFRPADEVLLAWLKQENERLQEFACEFGPSWAQGIGVIDAAQLLADQPTEGVDHERRKPSPPAKAPPDHPGDATNMVGQPLTDEQILALNAGEVFFSESPSRFPEAGHGTQYHAGAPGLINFARAIESAVLAGVKPAAV